MKKEMGSYESYIHKSRYARYLPEEKRRETWAETVQRYVNYFKDQGKINSKEAKRLYDDIYNLEVMPSMRALMTAGKALDRDNVAGFNCSYLPIDHPRSFDEMMYVLMCGTGVGFSVERQYVSKLPEVSEEMFSTETVINVVDSKIGWAKAFRELVSLLYAGQVPSWDVSNIRPAGAPLKTFGGRASGPEPLVELFKFTVETFKNAKGRKLSSIECHDLCCKIAQVVVVGGVRRSALISLSNLTDDRIRRAKHGQWWVDNPHRGLANNSACYTEKPDFEAFLSEWHSLYESRSGERGMFSRVASQKQAARNGRRDSEQEFGTNPCCFTGNMRLLTEKGYKKFEDLEGDIVNIVNVNGNITKGSVWCSGEKPTVEVRFHGEKDSITCTDDHIFMLTDGSECMAKDLKDKRLMPHYTIKESFDRRDGDSFLAGFIQGDGNTTRLKSEEHKGLEVYFGEKDEDIASMYLQDTGVWYSREAKRIAQEFSLSKETLPYRTLPSWTKEFIGGFNVGYFLTINDLDEFLSGLYSANGSVIKGHRIAFKSTCLELIEQIKNILYSTYNISSYITTNKSKKVEFSNGEYVCKESYDLNISKFDDIIKFATHISFGQQYKRDALEALILSKAPMVSAVKDFGIMKIYDFTEPETHWGIVEGVVVHNSEIILRPNQFCNLSEVVVRPNDTVDDLISKVRTATILGTLQATLTSFRYLRKKWRDNTEEEALLGVSLTGILDHAVMGDANNPDLPNVLNKLRDEAIATNKIWADKLGINASTAITCVKPSGTVSQLVDSASGIHGRFAPYYIRRVRADIRDPLCKVLEDSGVPSEIDITNPSTKVFSFYKKSPESSTIASEQTGVEQLKLWDIYQAHWCEHKPSITVYYRDDEFLEIGQWLYNNFDSCSGVSFLPYAEHTYKQAPYEAITAEEYEEGVKTLPDNIDWDIEEFEDNTEGSQTLACVGNSCEIS